MKAPATYAYSSLAGEVPVSLLAPRHLSQLLGCAYQYLLGASPSHLHLPTPVLLEIAYKYLLGAAGSLHPLLLPAYLQRCTQEEVSTPSSCLSTLDTLL